MIDRIVAVNGNFSCGKDVFRLLQTGRGFLNSEQVETDWSALKVTGSLDFSLTGILAGLATALAEADISLFALSTYDTDYVLVKSKPLSRACMALNSAGYILENG